MLMFARRVALTLLMVLAMIYASAGSAATKTTKNVLPTQISRGEYCLYIKDIWNNTTQGLHSCYQENNKVDMGVKANFGPVCPNNLAFACLAKYGQLVAGGWHYLYGDGIAYGIAPNTYLANAFRASSYVAPFSRMDQSFFARATIAGAFADGYGPYTKMCLEVYDWGQPDGKRLLVKQTLVGIDCIRPGDTIRQLEVRGTAVANHQMWIVASLHSDESDGVSYFSVAQISHDIS